MSRHTVVFTVAQHGGCWVDENAPVGCGSACVVLGCLLEHVVSSGCCVTEARKLQACPDEQEALALIRQHTCADGRWLLHTREVELVAAG